MIKNDLRGLEEKSERVPRDFRGAQRVKKVEQGTAKITPGAPILLPGGSLGGHVGGFKVKMKSNVERQIEQGEERGSLKKAEKAIVF